MQQFLSKSFSSSITPRVAFFFALVCLSRIVFGQSRCESASMETNAVSIVEADKVSILKREHSYKIGMYLKGIYIRENIMFFHFTLNNKSNINYDVDLLRFFIRDREQLKRTASQEITLLPIYRHGNDKLIPANAHQEVIYALNKFTIPDAKHLVIEMFEQNGGRHLSMTVKNRTIVNARPIPTL